MTGKKLNIGSGEFRKEGYINLDHRDFVGADVVHDLNVRPMPFPDGAFDRIEADHVLEHLDDAFATMRELYRVAADGAIISIRVPHFSRGFSHPEHRRGFDVSFPLYFDPTFKGGYEGVHLPLLSMRLTWFAQLYLKRETLPSYMYAGGRFLGWVFDFFANLSPYFCSRVWCFLVGGFDEIHYEFTVKKA